MRLAIGASHVWPRTSACLRSAPAEGRGERGCRRSTHNVLLGPPGVGTSRLARRRTPILPAMTLAGALETTSLYHVAGSEDSMVTTACASIAATLPRLLAVSIREFSPLHDGPNSEMMSIPHSRRSDLVNLSYIWGYCQATHNDACTANRSRFDR
jgi:hypothetical protein